MTPGDLLRLPQAITVRERASEADVPLMEQVAARVTLAVDGALRELDAMRATEGRHLRADLDARRALVGQLVESIAAAAEAGRAGVEERLRERVRQDIRKIRAREKELENRIEMVKSETGAVLAARESMILELKRKLDTAEFNLDLAHEIGRAHV